MGANSKIVIATDFSENSDRALEAGIEQAKRMEASVVLVHAFDIPVPAIYPYDVAVPNTLITESRKSAQDKLDKERAKVEAEGVPASTQLIESPAAVSIARLAEELDADLLVMGTRGNTGLKHIILGSVAERTIRLAPCSVLVVK